MISDRKQPALARERSSSCAASSGAASQARSLSSLQQSVQLQLKFWMNGTSDLPCDPVLRMLCKGAKGAVTRGVRGAELLSRLAQFQASKMSVRT